MNEDLITYYLTVRHVRKNDGNFETEYCASSITNLEEMTLRNNIILDKIFVSQVSTRLQKAVDQYYLIKNSNNEWIRVEVV